MLPRQPRQHAPFNTAAAMLPVIAAVMVMLTTSPAWAARTMPIKPAAKNGGSIPNSAISKGGGSQGYYMWSADVATGLANGTSGLGTIADPDDGAALVAALNSGMEIDLVVPVTGNAHVSAEFPLTRMILYDLKGRTDVPVEPGASSPILPFQDSPAAFINGTTVLERDLVAGCSSAGVHAMRQKLAMGVKRTILATGPLTDVACLVEKFPEEAKNIERVVALGGRHGAEPLVFGGVEGLTDFNIRMDPFAVQLLLDSETPLVFVPFNLSSSAVYPPDRFGEGLSAEQRETQAFNFFQAALIARAGWYERHGFGNVIVPWDTWPLLYVMEPDSLKCKPMVARLQQCAYAPWDASYNATNGLPYNDGGNAQMCGGHGPNVPSGSSLQHETAQLQFFPITDDSSFPITNADVVTVCDEVSSAVTYDMMTNLVLNKVY